MMKPMYGRPTARMPVGQAPTMSVPPSQGSAGWMSPREMRERGVYMGMLQPMLQKQAAPPGAAAVPRPKPQINTPDKTLTSMLGNGWLKKQSFFGGMFD